VAITVGAILKGIAGGDTFKVNPGRAIIGYPRGRYPKGDAFKEGGAYRNIGTTPSLGVHLCDVDTTASSSSIAGPGSAFIRRVRNPYRGPTRASPGDNRGDAR
jgi:hypothetical protein